MTILEPIQTRRSIRSYTSQEVQDDAVMEILEAARIAPSGSNKQPWSFIVVRSEEGRAQLAQVCHNQQWMTEAPVHIVCVANLQAHCAEPRQFSVDEESPEPEAKRAIRCTAIATDHLVLQAESMGLSTCWIAWFTQAEIRPVLGIPNDYYVVAVITVGYSNEQPEPRPRKAMSEIVRYESWSES